MKKLLITALIGVLFSCTNVCKEGASMHLKEVIEKKITLHDVKLDDPLIITLQSDSVSLIGNPVKVVSENGDIFICDANGQIIAFDYLGYMITRIGAIGNGPEEYPVVCGFDINNNEAYVSSFSHIYVYSKDGEYLRSIPKDANNQSIEVMNNNIYFIRPSKSSCLIQAIFSGDTTERTLVPNRYQTIIPYFGWLLAQDNKLYYKPEICDTLFIADANGETESTLALGLGDKGFNAELMDFAAKNLWDKHYRIANFINTERYYIILIQKGLMSQDIETLTPIFYDKLTGKAGFYSKPQEGGFMYKNRRYYPVCSYGKGFLCIAEQIEFNENPNLAIFNSI